MKSKLSKAEIKKQTLALEQAKEYEHLKEIRTQLERKILAYHRDLDRLLEDLDAINALIHVELIPPVSQLTLEIDWKELPVRVRSALEHLMITEGVPMRTYGDLLAIPLRKLYAMRNMGMKSLDELQAHLATLDLRMQ